MSKVVTHDDGTQVAEFQLDFLLEQKAESTVITEDANGDLFIEGYAADFEVDRQDEAFEPGAFARGLKSFMDTNPVMLYHHQYDKALGHFVDARLDDKGLWVKGMVDKPAPGSWAEDVVNKIKSKTIRGFSVGGIFKRRVNQQTGRPSIFHCDLAEISVTPFPVNPRTMFAVAGKAFEGVEVPTLPEVEGDVRAEDEELVSYAIAELQRVFDRIEKRQKPAADVTNL